MQTWKEITSIICWLFFNIFNITYDTSKQNLKRIILVCVFILTSMSVVGQDLSLHRDDLRIEGQTIDGFNLYIRNKPDISSVLLVESTVDPNMIADNYAYRAAEWNPINGDEIRLLNGIPLRSLYSLVSSTPVPHHELGEAFHIFVPWIVYYGYQNNRHGEVYVGDGTFFNIRTFELPYADYIGGFRDNPYVLHVTQRLPEGQVLTEDMLDFILDTANAGSGQITVSLLWDTADDLDLHVITPSGARIYYANMRAGGGVLDIDMNWQDRNIVLNPIENIFFTDPRPGTYTVKVINYLDRTPGIATNYLVRVTAGNNSETFTGSIEGTSTEHEIVAFTFP